MMFFEKIRVRLATDKALADMAYRETWLTHERNVELAMTKMLNTYCPILKQACSDVCIHFKHGHVSHAGDNVISRDPSCKLWK